MTKTTIQSATNPESARLIRDFLREHSSGVLTTANKAANPHAAVVYYTIDDDFVLSFGTKTETQKYKNITENNQVAFLVYDEAAQTVVQISGTAEIVDNPEQHDETMNNMVHASLEKSGTELPPAEKLYAGELQSLCIVPTSIRMAIYARPDSEGDDLYETLLFTQVAE